MATHSSVLAWRIPGMEEPSGLLSMGSHRVGHDWSDLTAAAAAWSPCLLLAYKFVGSVLLSFLFCCYSVDKSCLTHHDPVNSSLPRLLYPGDFPGKNPGVSSHSLLQGIFLTQELNLGLLHCRQILHHLRHQEIRKCQPKRCHSSIMIISSWRQLRKRAQDELSTFLQCTWKQDNKFLSWQCPPSPLGTKEGIAILSTEMSRHWESANLLLYTISFPYICPPTICHP